MTHALGERQNDGDKKKTTNISTGTIPCGLFRQTDSDADVFPHSAYSGGSITSRWWHGPPAPNWLWTGWTGPKTTPSWHCVRPRLESALRWSWWHTITASGCGSVDRVGWLPTDGQTPAGLDANVLQGQILKWVQVSVLAACELECKM